MGESSDISEALCGGMKALYQPLPSQWPSLNPLPVGEDTPFYVRYNQIY